MKKFIKYISAALLTFFILTLVSCQTIRLINIEKNYSREFRQELETLEDRELSEILRNEDKIEVLYKRFKKLEELEKTYHSEFKTALQKIEDKHYLDRLLDNKKAVQLLGDLYLYNEMLFYGVIEAGYSPEELNLISQTIDTLESSGYQETYFLNLANLSFLSAEQQGKLFEKFRSESYPTDKISSFITILETNEDFQNDPIGSGDEIEMIIVLEQFKDEELKEKIELELDNSYFETDSQKLDFVSEVLEMNEENMTIHFLFDNAYLNTHYNPDEKITWVQSFERLGFTKMVADALLQKLSEAEDPYDADGDGFCNLTEVSGLNKDGDPLPFIDKEGEPITYVNEHGEEIHRSSSNPLDPKDTPEHMATFDVVLINGGVEDRDGCL